jgi:hypothetical protein
VVFGGHERSRQRSWLRRAAVLLGVTAWCRPGRTTRVTGGGETLLGVLRRIGRKYTGDGTDDAEKDVVGGVASRRGKTGTQQTGCQNTRANGRHNAEQNQTRTTRRAARTRMRLSALARCWLQSAVHFLGEAGGVVTSCFSTARALWKKLAYDCEWGLQIMCTQRFYKSGQGKNNQ